MPGTTYPPAPPTVDGQRITVEQFLKNPSRVTRVLEDLTRERFLAERLFSTGDAQGGAVIYDQLLGSELYTERDVQQIEPGSEFPILTAGESAPKVAAVSKWGGAGVLTYESVRRDSRDVLNRQLTKIRNTIVRKIDTVAVAALLAAPIIVRPGTDWSDPVAGDPFGDLAGAGSAIDNSDMGYTAGLVVINPAQLLDLLKRKDVRDALPRESAASNPIMSGKLSGLMGLNEWYVSNRMPAGEALVTMPRMAGSLRDELPLYSRTIDQPERERYLVQAARVTVPIVTDPKSVVRLTGL